MVPLLCSAPLTLCAVHNPPHPPLHCPSPRLPILRQPPQALAPPRSKIPSAVGQVRSTASPCCWVKTVARAFWAHGGFLASPTASSRPRPDSRAPTLRLSPQTPQIEGPVRPSRLPPHCPAHPSTGLPWDAPLGAAAAAVRESLIGRREASVGGRGKQRGCGRVLPHPHVLPFPPLPPNTKKHGPYFWGVSRAAFPTAWVFVLVKGPAFCHCPSPVHHHHHYHHFSPRDTPYRRPNAFILLS